MSELRFKDQTSRELYVMKYKADFALVPPALFFLFIINCIIDSGPIGQQGVFYYLQCIMFFSALTSLAIFKATHHCILDKRYNNIVQNPPTQ